MNYNGLSGHEAGRVTLDAVLRQIDSEAYTLKLFIEECIREGDVDGPLPKQYCAQYNTLAILRQKLTPEALDVIKDWDSSGCQATKRVCVVTHEGVPHLQFFE